MPATFRGALWPRTPGASQPRLDTSGWRDFLGFCDAHQLLSLPATDETVAQYLAQLATRGRKTATIARRLVVISQAHKAATFSESSSTTKARRSILSSNEADRRPVDD